MPGLTKKKKIRRVLKQVDDPTVADVMTTTEEFDEDEFDESRELLNMRGGFREPLEMPAPLGRLPNQRAPNRNQINNLAEVSDHAGNGGWLSYIKDPFKRFPATQVGDSGYADVMIRDQMERDRLAEFDERFSPVAGVQGPEGFESEPYVERQEVTSGPSSMRGVRDIDINWMNTPFSSGKSQPEEKEAIVEEVTGLLGSPETEETLSGIEGEVLPATSNLIEEDAVRDTIEEPDFDPRIYDHYGEDIDGKEQRYLAALGDIYKKVAILNAVAALTNSPSQAGAFMQMASKKFETLEGFRTERRMQKIGKGVFFTEDGEFDAPKTKQEAYERAIAFGASPDEAAAISGDLEETATTTGSYTTWYNTITGETETFRPGFAPVDEEGNIIPGWIKGSKPQGAREERLFQDIERLIQANPIENFNEAYAQLRRYYLSAKDAMGQLLALRGEEADKMAFAQLRNTYEKLGLSMPTEGGERSKEILSNVTLDDKPLGR